MTKASQQFEDLIVKDFQKGIAESPHLGFADIRNLDIHSTPGVIQLGYLPAKVSGSTVTDLLKWFDKDNTTGNIYALGDSGNVYKSTDGGTTRSLIAGNTKTNGKGHGLRVFKNYVFVA